MNLVELAFGSKPIHIGAPLIRVADDLDILELYVPEHTFFRAGGLIQKLRNRTLSRRGHDALVAILTENAMITGQVDITKQVLTAIDYQWRRCPGRYVPDRRTVGSLFSRLAAQARRILA